MRMNRRRREMIACAVEVTRHWVHISHVERFANFWLMHRYIDHLRMDSKLDLDCNKYDYPSHMSV